MRIRIINGHIIDPINQIDAIGDICIAEGKIISVLDAAKDFSADQEIDASNKTVCPGLVDLCARFREPGQEHKATIASESTAAASAGITTICCPPDTDPVIDTAAVVELIHRRAELSNKTRIHPLGALTYALAGERLAEMQALIRAGCVGVSNAYSPITNTEVLRRALEYAASNNITVFLHAEDHYLRNDGVAHEGAVSTRLGLPPIPEIAETIAVSKILLMVEETGTSVHFCRLSSARSVAMIAAAKDSDLPVTADVGICQLHLTDNDIDNFNVNCHLYPPLRTKQDMEGLRQGVAQGVIDAICSDHQPHDDDAKAAPFSETEAGASTIDVMPSLITDLVNKNILPLSTALASINTNPPIAT